MRFKKKPIIVEAFKISDNWFNMNGKTTKEYPNELKGKGIRLDAGDRPGILLSLEDDWEFGRVFIETLEGEMKGNLGDWIIIGVKGEVYPCKPDIFSETYDKVEG